MKKKKIHGMKRRTPQPNTPTEKKKKKKKLPQRCRLVQGCAKIMNAGESGTTGE